MTVLRQLPGWRKDCNGIETIAHADEAFFDHDGEIFHELVSWAQSDDGILVRDINGDVMTSGRGYVRMNHLNSANMVLQQLSGGD